MVSPPPPSTAHQAKDCGSILGTAQWHMNLCLCLAPQRALSASATCGHQLRRGGIPVWGTHHPSADWVFRLPGLGSDVPKAQAPEKCLPGWMSQNGLCQEGFHQSSALSTLHTFTKPAWPSPPRLSNWGRGLNVLGRVSEDPSCCPHMSSLKYFSLEGRDCLREPWRNFKQRFWPDAFDPPALSGPHWKRLSPLA